MKKEKLGILGNVLMIVCSIVIIYPLLWLLGASFKSNNEIFTTQGILPKEITFEGYVKGWQGIGQITFSRFFNNSMLLTVPTVILTIISSCLVAYGFSRFNFKGKKLLFGLMLSTMMLPNSIIMIPRYIIFMRFGWLNSYKPFYALALFAANPFFQYLLIQFFRGIPRELDESAYLDGCSSVKILTSIIAPLAKASIVSAALFQFLWTWNDFNNALIYIDSVKKYPVSLGLRLSIDSDAKVGWNKVTAMTVLGMLPCVILFFIFQKSFVEGVAKSGLKG